MVKKDIQKELKQKMKDLNLSTMREYLSTITAKAKENSFSYEEYLFELLNTECDSRWNKKIHRHLKESKLPLEKNLESFEVKRLPRKVNQQVKTLLNGSFIDLKENVLAFGNPGSGKTHLLCAIMQELIRNQQRRCYFTKCELLVQELLLAKKELRLPQYLKRISKFDVLIIDDIGYVHQGREEMEVLFTLLAERYERGSVMITSNLPFSKWEKIFKDPMITAAAIDRLIHHSVIVELNLPSYRIEQAKSKKKLNSSG